MASFVEFCNATVIFQHLIRSPFNSRVDIDPLFLAHKEIDTTLLLDYTLLGKLHIRGSLQELYGVQRQSKCRERELNLLEKKSSKLLNFIE